MMVLIINTAQKTQNKTVHYLQHDEDGENAIGEVQVVVLNEVNEYECVIGSAVGP